MVTRLTLPVPPALGLEASQTTSVSTRLTFRCRRFSNPTASTVWFPRPRVRSLCSFRQFPFLTASLDLERANPEPPHRDFEFLKHVWVRIRVGGYCRKASWSAHLPPPPSKRRMCDVPLPSRGDRTSPPSSPHLLKPVY